MKSSLRFLPVVIPVVLLLFGCQLRGPRPAEVKDLWKPILSNQPGVQVLHDSKGLGVKTPLYKGHTPTVILKGIVLKVETNEVEENYVYITIEDDAGCEHKLRLLGHPDQFHVDEYNIIILSGVTQFSWGAVEEVFLGEDALEALADEN